MSLLTFGRHWGVFSNKLTRRLARFVRTLETRRQIAEERRMLASLDDRILKDIGISRVDAAFEASRPSSDIPADRMPRDDVITGNHRSQLHRTCGSAC